MEDLLQKAQQLQPNRNDMRAYTHLVRGYKILIDGKASLESQTRFRQELKDASVLLDSGTPERAAIEALAKGATVTSQILTMLSQLVKKRLQEIIDDETPSHAETATTSKRKRLHQGDAGSVKEMKTEIKSETNDDDEDEEEDEEQGDELELDKIILQFSPLVWEDPVQKMWQFAIFVNQDTNSVYDDVLQQTFPSQEAATVALENVTNLIDSAGNNGYRELAMRAIQSWRMHNQTRACRDTQGTERMDVIGEDGTIDRYLIVFSSFGYNQLANVQIYKTIMEKPSESDIDVELKELAQYVKSNLNTWVTMVLKPVASLLSTIDVMFADFTTCQEVAGSRPVVGMVSVVLRFERNVDQSFIDQVDNTIFDNM